jgi:hypothetical protein
MLEHANVVLSNQNIPSDISQAWDSHAMLEHTKVVLSNQNISSEISEAWDSQAMLEHARKTFGQQNPLNITLPTFCTSLVSKHLSAVNLVQSSTYILNLK